MERAKCAPAPRLSNETARKPSEGAQVGFLEVEWTGGSLLKPGDALAACKTLEKHIQFDLALQLPYAAHRTHRCCVTGLAQSI